MKKLYLYLVLSGLMATHADMAMTKKEMFVSGLSKIKDKSLVILSPLGKGFAFAGQKLKQNKKLAFISMGILSVIDIGLYCNSEKMKDSWKPEALFGKNKSFNPFTSHFAARIFENFSNFYNILCGKHINLDNTKENNTKNENLENAAKIYLKDIVAIKQVLFTKVDNVNDIKQETVIKAINDLKEEKTKSFNEREKTVQNTNDITRSLDKQINTLKIEKENLTNQIEELKKLSEKNIEDTKNEQINIINLKQEEIQNLSNRITEIENSKNTQINELVDELKEKNIKITDLENDLKNSEELLDKVNKLEKNKNDEKSDEE